MNPFTSFARNRTKTVFIRPWGLLFALSFFMVFLILGLTLLLRFPFQEGIGVPGIIRSEPSTRIIKSPSSGRIQEWLARPWDDVQQDEILVVLNQEWVEAELTQHQDVLARLTNDDWVIERLVLAIRRGESNPFDPNTQSYGNQLYLQFYQEYQVLAHALRAKDIELTQYQSLPSSMQKQAVHASLLLQLEELDGRLQVFIESYVAQLFQNQKQVVTQLEELKHRLHQIEIQRKSLVLKADVPGQIIPLGNHAPGSWVAQGEPLLLLVPRTLDQIFIEMEIPQNQRSRIKLPSQIRFFSVDRNQRNASLVESQLIRISEQPVPKGSHRTNEMVFIGRSLVDKKDYPWLVPETSGIAWIQGSQLSLLDWIIDLLDITFSQGFWWQRIRDLSGVRYSNPQKLPFTSLIHFNMQYRRS